MKAKTMTTLNKQDLQAVRAALENRKGVLLAEIRAALADSDDTQFRAVLGGSPGDSSDEALAASLADLSAARIDREVREYRALEATEQRMGDAGFGTCADCDAAIPAARLVANPAATRCVQCQEMFDKTHAGQAHGSL